MTSIWWNTTSLLFNTTPFLSNTASEISNTTPIYPNKIRRPTKSNATTRSVYIGLDVFNSIFQMLCCYLLIVIFRKSLRKKTQDLYIINLALSELFASIFLTARDIVNLMRLFDGNHNGDNTVDIAFWSMNMFFVTGIQYIYILAMIYITGDRLLHIKLTIKYQSYWNIKMSWRLLICTWICCICNGIGFTSLMIFKYEYARYQLSLSSIMSIKILSLWYTIFLIFAAITYIYIFSRYVRSGRNLIINPRSKLDKESTPEEGGSLANQTTWLFKSFTTSKFYIPFALISTYMVLTVIPSVIRSSIYMQGFKIPYELTFLYACSVRISYTVDGVIYVFLQKRVRRLFFQKLRCCGTAPDESFISSELCRSGLRSNTSQASTTL